MAVAAQCPWYRDHAAGLLKVKTFLKANVLDIGHIHSGAFAHLQV